MNSSAEHKARPNSLLQTPAIQLTYDCDSRICAETVRSMIRGRDIKTVLDAACGTGDVLLPLLDRLDKITMIDSSEQMLRIAADRIPLKRKDDVRLIKGDIQDWDEQSKYKLVLSMSDIKDLDDPEKYLSQLTQFVSRGGYIIFKNTDGMHPYTLVHRFLYMFKHVVSRGGVRQRWISNRRIKRLMRVYGFVPRKKWRYNESWLGLSGLVDNKKKYAITRAWFGRIREPRLQLLGSEVIYMYKRM